MGKSSLLYILGRRGEVLPIPRADTVPRRLLDYIVLHWDGEPIIWLDLPRRRKLGVEDAETLEDLKDGLVASSKYTGGTVYMRGTKIIVTTNNYIDPKVYKQLTPDRWDVHPTKDEIAALGLVGGGTSR